MAATVFKGQTFCFSGTLSMKRNELEALVKKHGGACGGSVTKKTSHLVTTQNEIDSSTAKVVKAQELKDTCSIVSEEFVHESIKQAKLQDPESFAVGGGASSSSATPTLESAPKSNKRKANDLLEKCSPKWTVRGTSSMYGIFVDDNLCMCGDENGWLLDVDHDTGAVKNKVKLPTGVKAIVRDRGGFLYAGCNDGSVYDCTDLSAPRLMKPAEASTSQPIQWADIYDGNLLINQSMFGCSMLNIEGEVVWTSPARGYSAWTVRNDTSNVYYSSDRDLITLDFATGKELWRRQATSAISFGVLYDKVMYVSEHGISGIPTNATDPIVIYPHSSTFSACAANEENVFGGETKIVVYDRKSAALVKTLSVSAGQIMSMQIHNNRLYLVTAANTFECITLDNTNQKTTTVSFRPAATATSSVVETIEVAAEARAGEIVCECIKEGGRLRIRPIAGGYNQSWNVQFPSNLREEGAKYVVEELLEAANGGYYRAKGSIKKLA